MVHYYFELISTFTSPCKSEIADFSLLSFIEIAELFSTNSSLSKNEPTGFFLRSFIEIVKTKTTYFQKTLTKSKTKQIINQSSDSDNPDLPSIF